MYATSGISLQPPASRREIPPLSLKPHQISGLLERLRTFWNRFAALFQRREQREWGLKYIQGRLMDGEKRYTQPLARRLGEKMCGRCKTSSAPPLGMTRLCWKSISGRSRKRWGNRRGW